MQDAAEIKKVKDRSPSFPFITLERALERASQFYAEERRGVAPFTRAVMHWKYSEASSGGLQTVAALKSYGLLNESGGTGKERQLQLSELALRIVLDKRPDEEAGGERLALIRRAALSPSVSAEVHSKWPDHLPSPTTLNHYLVIEKKFNEASVGTVIKILLENQAFAKLDGQVIQSAEDDEEEDIGMPTDLINDRVVAPPPLSQRARPTGMAPLQVAPPAPARVVPASTYSEHILHSDGQSITLTFSAAPTSDVYEYLEQFAAFRAGVLKKREEREAKTPAVVPLNPSQDDEDL
jgi:hypothetical protein